MRHPWNIGPARWTRAGTAQRGVPTVVLLILLLGLQTAPAAPDRVVLPYELRRGHLMVPARVNETNAPRLMLDTGYTMTMLEPTLANALNLRRAGSVTIVGIAGEEEAAQFDGPTFDFQGMSWRPRRVAAFPSSGSSLARQRDGVLGSGFFRRFVVAIDPQARTVTLHEPSSFSAPTNAEVIPLRFRRSTPILSATLTATDQSSVRGEFELDLGCDSALCLGQPFAATNRLAPVNGEGRRGSRTGVGGGTRTRTVKMAALELGRLRVVRPEANIFDAGSPADPGLAGHIGLEALLGFHIILDYSRRQMILSPLPARKVR